jgi:two-component system CheB/CheR fusion protein
MNEAPPAPADVVASTSAPSHVVALGASAGGLEPLEAFFARLPEDTGLAFVVVQHLSPDHKSMMAELLAKHTSMPIQRIEDGTRLLANHIYLAPPRKNVVVEEGVLHLEEKPLGAVLNLPIDIFFTSLATVYGERAVGVVLSGTGSDGMRGVRALKEQGGFVLVQEESTARFDGMPRSAISTGLVDVVASPEELPVRLLTYVRYVATSPARSARVEDHLATILALLRRHSGVDFTNYKPMTVHRRIERRMQVNQTPDLAAYVAILKTQPREVALLYKELLIGVTRFFRDPEAYEVVARKVVGPLLDQARPGGAVRVWVAGCATGEEAYSLAILFREQIEERGLTLDLKIFATDIDRAALAVAGAGVYSESIVADVSPERLEKHFVPKGDAWVVRRELRQLVIFAPHDVTHDPPFTKIDLVSCRNLLIYLEPELQRKVLSLLHFALEPGGYVFLGASETVGEMADRLRNIDTRAKLFQSIGGPRALPADAMPLSSRSRAAERTRDEHASAIDLAWQSLVSEYAPPALLVDEFGELVHVFGDASGFLRIPAGAMSMQVLKLVPKGISAILSVALQKVLREQRDITYQSIRPHGGDSAETVALQVRLLRDVRGARRYVLVLVERPRKSLLQGVETLEAAPGADSSIIDLQQELQYARESLQATIEELETSNEELQATNEELLASNEELQATNEELQSVNEELYTVNTEYQHKIEELVEVNNDIDNLLRSTDIGTLFLDERLLIRRFTPVVSTLVNVMPRDIGRPIEHISLNIEDPAFVEDLRRVLENPAPIERHVPSRDGRTYLMRLLPYMANDSSAKGVVATFVDITASELRKQRLQRLIDSLPQGICVVDPSGVVQLANARFADVPIGGDYLATWSGPEGDAIREGVLSVLRGRKPEFTKIVAAPATGGRWIVQATPMEWEAGGGAVVTHTTLVES